MDDITEAKAKAKERRKMSRTQSKDFQEENDSSADILKPTTSKPLDGKKKNLDLSNLMRSGSTKRSPGPGIVCTNTDLISIMSPLTSSAQEICGIGEKDVPTLITNPNTGSPTTQQKTILDKKRKLFKDRSNSFDVGSSPGTILGPASWFVKRHQPIAKKGDMEKEKSQILVTFTDEKQKVHTSLVNKQPERTKSFKLNDSKKSSSSSSSTTTSTGSSNQDRVNQVVWDNRSGSLVDPHLIGSAIEVFLNKKTSNNNEQPTSPITKSPVQVKETITNPATTPPSKSWFNSDKETSGGGDGSGANTESATETCDTSICSTLKDLFVK